MSINHITHQNATNHIHSDWEADTYLNYEIVPHIIGNDVEDYLDTDFLDGVMNPDDWVFRGINYLEIYSRKNTYFNPEKHQPEVYAEDMDSEAHYLHIQK